MLHQVRDGEHRGGDTLIDESLKTLAEEFAPDSCASIATR
jgi:hypothetical protein